MKSSEKPGLRAAGPPERDYGVAAPPQQDRSRQTLRRILAAAEEMFADAGFHGATIPEICRLAQSSPGAFYKRFRDKDELLSVLFADLIVSIRTGIEGALEPEIVAREDLPSIAASVVAELAAVFRTRAGLFRVLAVVGDSRPEFIDVSNRVYRELTGRLQGVLASKRAEFTHPDPSVAGIFAADLAVAVLRQKALLARSADAAAASEWALVERELLRALLGYLGVQARDAS